MLFGLTSRRFASRVFFDLSVNGKAGNFFFRFSYFEIFLAGRLTFKLHDDITPKCAENFRQLCTGEPGFGYEERGLNFFARFKKLHEVLDKNCKKRINKSHF